MLTTLTKPHKGVLTVSDDREFEAATVAQPMASSLADAASAGAIVAAGVVTFAGLVPLIAGLVAAFMDGQLASAFVPVGGIITLIGALGCVGAALFRRAHMRARARLGLTRGGRDD